MVLLNSHSSREMKTTISPCLMLIVKVRLLSQPGNSLSAILDGIAKLTFLKRDEDYYIAMPYAHCKGKIIITLRVHSHSLKIT